MRVRILLALRHEAAIDHDHGATRKLGRREHPIATPVISGRMLEPAA